MLGGKLETLPPGLEIPLIGRRGGVGRSAMVGVGGASHFAVAAEDCDSRGRLERGDIGETVGLGAFAGGEGLMRRGSTKEGRQRNEAAEAIACVVVGDLLDSVGWLVIGL